MKVHGVNTFTSHVLVRSFCKFSSDLFTAFAAKKRAVLLCKVHVHSRTNAWFSVKPENSVGMSWSKKNNLSAKFFLFIVISLGFFATNRNIVSVIANAKYYK